METKEELVNNIKEWIKLDTEINKLNTEMKARKNKKKDITLALVETMKKNDIDCFDITGGSLVYKTNKVRKPINVKTLMSALQTFYKDNPEMAEDITKHVLESREVVVKETVLRKVDKIALPAVEK